ncbi:MAG: outer membrane lipoprotein-sorting protein [Acidobacteria bacterium]|nr:outer membrane lipoprotein-sorting protein [Acidobacteriota bacterium]
MLRSLLFAAALGLACSMVGNAQTVDELVANYVKTIGGMDKLQSIKSMRQTGTFHGGGGFEASVVEEQQRPGMIREAFSIQGMSQIVAYDGKQGWKIDPFQGKKDAETLGEEELKSIVEDSDFDGPLVNYKEKGNRIEYLGKEDLEGSDVYKLKVTLADGTVKTFYLDTDYYVPIKIETKQTIRGTEIETEAILGDYKQVGGVYFPHSFENGVKGSPNKTSVTIDKIEINPSLSDSLFAMPHTGPGPKVSH